MLIGAIAGDVIGSVYEADNVKSRDFPLFGPDSRFTDDTVMTIAVADALLHDVPFDEAFRHYFALYPDAGYGALFAIWAMKPGLGPYGSWGNGSAMRVSPVAWPWDDEQDVLDAARATALPTHDHRDGVRGAEAVALAVLLARKGLRPQQVAERVAARCGYDLDFTLDEIREDYAFDLSCNGSVPQALVAFRDSTGYEDAIRGAISIGGDSDTIGCMTGAIAGACYGVPPDIAAETRARLDDELRAVLDEFEARFCAPPSGRPN